VDGKNRCANEGENCPRWISVEKNDWRAEKIRLDKNGVTFRVSGTAKKNFAASIGSICSVAIRW
jgi:hypothetical protein